MAKKKATTKRPAKRGSELPNLKRKGEPAPIECPGCGCGHFHPVSERKLPSGKVRYVKQCRHCARRVNWTPERI